MILKSLTPKNLGPFATNSTLHLESEVTVLTGPNDVGKSLALRAIELLCTSASATERERNRSRISQFAGVWNEDPEFACEATFTATESTASAHFSKEVRSGDEISIKKRLNQASHHFELIQVQRRDTLSKPSALSIRKWPSIVKLPRDAEIKEVIQFDSMNAAESDFIKLGFGPAFSAHAHMSLDPTDRSLRTREVEEDFNRLLAGLFPANSSYRFLLQEIAGDPSKLGIMLGDKHKLHTPLGHRGSGIRRLLNTLAALMRVTPDSNQTIILYDEPEISLHADAQHALRRLLEKLATHPNIQVVYTTHSPAMINTLRPHSIRVIERTNVEGQPTSRFSSQASNRNFLLVRSSLGISPADSLLYSPITLIVEGPTEVRCVPFVLKKLGVAGILDLDLVDKLLSLLHCLDGEGSSFEYMCRLAKSQGAHPVVFLDGDKPKDVDSVKAKHPSVPIISLDQGKEFEEILPKSIYIQAVQEILEHDSSIITESAFDEWHDRTQPKHSMMFSKKIERWLTDDFEKPLYKPLAMQKAIELADPTLIDSTPFQQILEATKSIAEKF